MFEEQELREVVTVKFVGEIDLESVEAVSAPIFEALKEGKASRFRWTAAKSRSSNTLTGARR